MGNMISTLNNIHIGYKIAAVIFFAGTAYAGYLNLKSDVEELKNNQIEIVGLKIETRVLTEKVSALEKKLDKMDTKLDKIIENTR